MDPAQLWKMTVGDPPKVQTRYGMARVIGLHRTRLKLPEAVVVCDPHQMRGESPLLRAVFPGLWVVAAFVVKGRTKNLNGQRVAAVCAFHGSYATRLRQITRFEPACRSGSSSNLLVDSAQGCITHPDAVERFFRSDSLRARFHDHIEAMTYITDFRERGATAIAFETGMGDGSYPMWWGFGDQEAPIAFLIDFQMIGEMTSRVAVRDEPPARRKGPDRPKRTPPAAKPARPFRKVCDEAVDIGKELCRVNRSIESHEFADERGNLSERNHADLVACKKKSKELTKRFRRLHKELSDGHADSCRDLYKEQRSRCESERDRKEKEGEGTGSLQAEIRAWDALGRGKKAPHALHWIWSRAVLAGERS